VFSRVEDVQYIFANRHIYDVSDLVTSSFGILFPNGLISLRGDTWKRHARFMLPTFKRAKVLPYLDTVVSCIGRFIEEQFVHRDGQIHSDLV
jgi:cytochrome P450